MKIIVKRSGSIDDFNKAVSEMNKDKSIKGIMCLACDGNDYTPKAIDPILNTLTVPVFGGIFPEIIHNNEKLEEGVIVAGINDEVDVSVIPGLSREESDFEILIEKQFTPEKLPETIFLFIDGLAGRISSFIEALFDLYGLDINYIGGGAGSLSFQQKPCLFTNHGLIADSALIVSTGIVSGIGIKHGWEVINQAYTVTESDKNRIISLNWKPAFEVYKEVVEEHSGMTFSEDNFFEIAKSYPFGINILGAENIVRDPLMKGENNSLICVGEVPENSVVDILTGNKSSLVKAAGEALLEAKSNFQQKGKSMKTTLFIDCISRVLFLEDAFQDELNAVYDRGFPMLGALTLGELANAGKNYLEFYNKTAVLGVIDQ